ncbi:MAG: AAA family ATPase [Muribaculaceae bacterium]|nr:AAA family ATPase [Muribaculaceae bacterium]
MLLSRIIINNFRSIENLTIECGRGVNVFAGVNGAGKSTVLHAILINLSWLKARMRGTSARGLMIDFSDIRHGAVSSSVTTIADEACWQIARVAPARISEAKSELGMLGRYAADLMGRYYESGGRVNLPMIVAYSVNRSLVDIPARVLKKHELDAPALFSADIDGGMRLRAFYEWFREREDIENEIKNECRDLNVEDSQLRAVRNAIAMAMPGYTDLHVRRRKPAGFELKKDGHGFRVNQLSDGEKCYLTLIGDIARRLAICNPALENPLQGQGIVIIDELELHLHPAWQSEAIETFRRVFPNCQFFISTHSPHIVQNLQLEGNDTLSVLENGRLLPVSASYGESIEQLYYRVFNMKSLLPAPVQNTLDDIWGRLANGDADSEGLCKAIEKLRLYLSPGNIEFARIRMQIAKIQKAKQL